MGAPQHQHRDGRAVPPPQPLPQDVLPVEGALFAGRTRLTVGQGPQVNRGAAAKGDRIAQEDSRGVRRGQCGIKTNLGGRQKVTAATEMKSRGWSTRRTLQYRGASPI